jgi:hypothetical protein
MKKENLESLEYHKYISQIKAFDENNLKGVTFEGDKFAYLENLIKTQQSANISYLESCKIQGRSYDESYKTDFFHAIDELEFAAIKFLLNLSLDYLPSIETLYGCIDKLINRFVRLYASNSDHKLIEPHFYILDIAVECFRKYPHDSYIQVIEHLLRVEIREEDDLDVFFLFLKRMIIGLFKYNKENIKHIIKMGLEHKNQFVQEETVDLLENLDYPAGSRS